MASVKKHKSAIMAQARAALLEHNETGDWRVFAEKMEEIYRTYAFGGKEMQEAMVDILCLPRNPKKIRETEILFGNYGFHVLGHKQEELKKDAEIIEHLGKRFGKKAAGTYMKGMNPCHIVLLSEKSRMNKSLDTVTESVIATL